MQKTFLLLFACLFTWDLWAQASTSLYSENFNGASHTFTLNTTDQSSIVGGANLWIVNNSYAGGSGSVVCFGFPFSFTVPTTNSQPSGIVGNPTSKYMHILSTAAQSSGLSNACYSAADGLCTNDENYFTKMSSDVTTTGFDSVELSFWWLCAGEAGTNYGEVYYSTNGGSSWTLATATQYQGQSNWTQTKVSIPAFESQATLRFGFRFVNMSASSPADPPFSLDDVQITGFNLYSLRADSLNTNSLCAGSPVKAYYTANNFAAGNTFTVQLSDASGSFASPVNIGTATTTASGFVQCIIPLTSVAGTGYLIRLVGSNPAGVSDNTLSLSILPKGDASTIVGAMDSICGGDSTMISIGTTVGTLTMYRASNGASYTPTAVSSGSTSFNTGALTSATWYYYLVASAACGLDTSNTVQIAVAPMPVATFAANQQFGTLTTSFNNTSTDATSYFWEFGDGNTSANTSPTYTYATAGSYSVTLTAVNSLGCSDELVQTVSIVPVGIEKLDNLAGANLYPNPNNGAAQLEFELLQDQDMTLRIYSTLGQLVKNQAIGMLQQGKHNLPITLPNELPTGTYLIELQGSQVRFFQKMNVLR